MFPQNRKFFCPPPPKKNQTYFIKEMKKWLILMVLPLLICELSFFNVWYMDKWVHSNSNNIDKVNPMF